MNADRTVMMLALALAACGGGEPGAVDRSGPPLDVSVSEPVHAPVTATYAAEIVSERTAEIATRISGTVRAVHVEIGSRVASGEPLVELDDQDIEGRVRTARAALVLAEKEHGRIERLAADGAASLQELDRSTAALEEARSAVAEAAAQQGYAVVRAPFDGVVTARSVDPGDLAAPARPLLTVVDPTRVHVAAELPAELMTRVRAGTSVEIEVPGQGAPIPARVARVSPAVGGGGRTFRVEVQPSEPLPGAHPGAYARLHLAGGDTGTRWIPADAIVERGQLRGVFVVEEQALRLRWVRPGLERAGAVEILSGLDASARVVRRPPPDLFDGAPVGSVRDEPWGLEVGDPAAGADR